MMTAVVALVILANFVLASVVGVRLLRMRSDEAFSPERLLGIYLVVGVTLSGVLVAAAYGAWSARGQAESTGVLTAVHAAGQILLAIGYVCVIGFTWRTFHREAPWARALAAVLGLLIAISLGGRALIEGFAIRVDPGLYHWLAYVARIAGLVWMGGVSLSYWRRMKKRLALGLADAVVVNRFVLWAVFAFGTVMSAMSEPIARVVYHMTVGDQIESAQSITQVGGPIIQMALFLTSISGMLTVAALFLTFFPTKAYTRWVMGETA